MKNLPLVLAIEFPGPTKLKPYFDRALAQGLANQLAFELAKHVPSIEGLGLVWMAAVYDQAQLLRPGFPVFKALADLYEAGLSKDQPPQVLTLQARLAQAPLPALQVDEYLLGGPMVFVPMCVIGSELAITSAKELLESKLLDSGLADARTALFLNQALGADAEHARLMTLDDLAALTAIQLDNMGFTDVWQVIEHQLFRLRDAPPDGNYLGTRERVSVVKLESIAASDLANKLEHYAARKLRERQVLSLLQAHGVNYEFDFQIQTGHSELSVNCDYWLHWFDQGVVHALQPLTHASVGLTCVQLMDAHNQVVGLAHPLGVDAWTALRARFATAGLA